LAWLRQLEKQHGQAWYDGFYRWYTDRLSHLKREQYCDNIENIFGMTKWGSPQASWHPTDPSLEKLTHCLSNVSISAAPDAYVGRHNGHSMGVVFNGSALDPPQVSSEAFKSLGVQYAHLPIFTGLRIQESKDSLRLLILGKVCSASTRR